MWCNFFIHFDEFFFEFSNRFNFSRRFTSHCNQVSARKKAPNVKEMLDFLDFILKYTHGRSAGWLVGPVSLEFSFAFHLFFKLLFWLSCESSLFFASAFTIHISAAFCVKSVQPPLVCRSRPVQHAVAYYERLLRFIFCKKFSKKKTLFLLHVVQSTDPVHKRGSKKKLYA